MSKVPTLHDLVTPVPGSAAGHRTGPIHDVRRRNSDRVGKRLLTPEASPTPTDSRHDDNGTIKVNATVASCNGDHIGVELKRPASGGQRNERRSRSWPLAQPELAPSPLRARPPLKLEQLLSYHPPKEENHQGSTVKLGIGAQPCVNKAGAGGSVKAFSLSYFEKELENVNPGPHRPQLSGSIGR